MFTYDVYVPGEGVVVPPPVVEDLVDQVLNVEPGLSAHAQRT